MSVLAQLSGLLAASSFFADNAGWIVAGLIVVVGLFVLGAADVGRFSFTRVWAISGVCFAESIRKRVLWITPLAIIGVLTVTQLERALDEQDAIRQTIKFCLFATGMVVILSSIILACTNLPKEIESRVIFTIVTKPTTRLEVILGKVIGFARVSGAIVLIMGIFTWSYLMIRSQSKLSEINTRVQAGSVSDTERARLVHYTDVGLLTSRKLWAPDMLQVMAQRPDPNKPGMLHGDGEEEFSVPFVMHRDQMFPGGPDKGIGELGLVIQVNLDWARTGEIQDSLDPDQITVESPVLGPTLPTTRPKKEQRPPAVNIELQDKDHFNMVPGGNMVGGTTPELLSEHIGQRENDKAHAQVPVWNASRVRLHPPGEQGCAYAWVPPNLCAPLYRQSTFLVRVTGANGNVNYLVGKEPVKIFIPAIDPQHSRIALTNPPATEVRQMMDSGGEPIPPVFRGRAGIHGEQQLQGGVDPLPAAVYSFRNAPQAELSKGGIPFEIVTSVQRSNASDNDESKEDPTVLAVTVHDQKSGKDTQTQVQVESNQQAFFSVPAGAITGGNFDVIIQSKNTGHTVGLFPESLQLVSGRDSFALNLIKSLAIVWMMSVLVITLAILCSTFVSWPIAIVLTVILLLGHWGVNQIADANSVGLGRQIVNDFKVGDKDAPIAKMVSTSVDALSSALNNFAKVLPDTSQFEAIEDIEQGVSVSGAKLAEASKVLLCFGVPAVVLAYLILKRKEVAP